jgi:hypothetical protein
VHAPYQRIELSITLRNVTKNWLILALRPIFFVTTCMWTTSCRRGGMSRLQWCGVAAILATITTADAVAQQHYTVKGSIDVFTYEVRVHRSLLTP